MSIDACPDRPDRAFLLELADEIERRAERDRRRLRLLQRDGARWGSDEAATLEAELVLLARAARATEQLIEVREKKR